MLILILAVIAGFTHSNIVRCTFIGFSDHRHLGDGVYASSAIDRGEDKAILTMIDQARTRISHHFGQPIAKPTIIIVSGHEQAARFGLGAAPGTVLIAPWGNYVLLNHQSANLDVAAHELVHAEIAHRLGYFDRARKFPTWLDEGIALQVDYRPEYALLFKVDNEELERVLSLQSPRQFWSDDTALTIQNYRSSKAAVNMTFFKKDMQSSLYPLLDKISDGADVQSLLGVRQ